MRAPTPHVVLRVLQSADSPYRRTGLFPDVLKNMQTDDLEQKKLVYLYVAHSSFSLNSSSAG